MAADVPSSSGDDEMGPISGINVTPFVDVVLVLLVIFMVTAPMIMKDVLQVKLPKSATSDGKAAESLGIAVTRQGQLLVNGEVATDEAVTRAAREAVQKDAQTQVIIAADSEAKHGDVVRAIDLVKTAGIERFALQIQKAIQETQ